MWDEIGRTHGLTSVGWMRSVDLEGPVPAVLGGAESGRLEGTFRWDSRPGDTSNNATISALCQRLLAISVAPNKTPYVNLQLESGDWTTGLIDDVAGQAPKIRELAHRTGSVVLGGKAPVWAYLAGLRCALDANPHARVFFYDPKQPERLVEIPSQPRRGPTDFPADTLHVAWAEESDRAVLKLSAATADKFLPPTTAQNMAGAPIPPDLPASSVGLSGPMPTWVFGTYARWLIAGGGVRQLASWDGRLKTFVEVWHD